MIFQRRAKRYDCNFYIGNEKIDIVQSYTYLGTQISSTGNFTLSMEHLREKAVHVFFSHKTTPRLQQFETISCLQNV